MRRHEALVLLGLFVLAALVRAAFVFEVRDLPTQHRLVMDAEEYDKLARQLPAAGWRPREAFYQSPLYPYYLAAIYAAAGPSHLAVRIFQLLMDAGTVVILAVVARRLFGPSAGLAAGLLAALYGPAIFSVPLILKSSLLLFLEALLLLALVPSAPPLRARRALLAGLLLGAAALLQGNTLLLLPFLGLHLLLRRELLPALAVGAGMAAALAPAAIVNYLAGGEVVLTSSHGGENFYIGNSRNASGTYVPLSAGSQHPESNRATTRRMAAEIESRRSGRTVSAGSLSGGEVDSILRRETVRQIREAPLRWLRLLLWKTRLFWNAHEIPDAEGYAVYKREAGWTAIAWIGFGLLAPLGLTGFWLAWRDGRWEAGALLAWLTLATCASVVLFFVFGRYRLGVVPFLVPPAGFALVRLAELLRRSDRRPALPALAVLFGLTLMVNLPAWSRAEVSAQDSGIYFNLSSAAIRLAEAADPRRSAEPIRRAAQAVGYLEKARAADPGFFVAAVQEGAALNRLGLYLAAAGRYEEALKPYGEAHRQLTDALDSGLGADQPGVRRQAREILAAVDGHAATALGNAGVTLLRQGDLARAEQVFRRAAAFASGRAESQGNLGLCLLQRGLAFERAGQTGEARARFAESREILAHALELAGPGARPELVTLYRQGLEEAEKRP